MFNMECCTLQQIKIWFYASKNLSQVTYSLIDLLKIRVYSVHFKLLLLILCPNILIRYIKVSLFSGGGLQIEIFQAGDAGKGKGWQFCIFLGDRQKKGGSIFLGGAATLIATTLQIIRCCCTTKHKEFHENEAGSLCEKKPKRVSSCGDYIMVATFQNFSFAFRKQKFVDDD